MKQPRPARGRTWFFVLAITMATAVNLGTSHEGIGSSAGQSSTDDGNERIFDDLEVIMQQNDGPIPTLVLFVDHPTETYVSSLKEEIGPFFVKYLYEASPGIAASLTAPQIRQLAMRPEVVQIEYDGPVRLLSNQYRQWYGVDKAVTDFGVNGDRDGNSESFSSTDIVICIVDTGINANHVDLDQGQVIHWKDILNSQPSPWDDSSGHGTHVASVAVGQGDGDWAKRGVAFGASLVVVRALGAGGTSSDALAGIDYCRTQRTTYNIRIMNLSWEIPSACSNGTGQTSLSVNAAFNEGIVPIVAISNLGPAACTVYNPASARMAIAVCNMHDVDSGGFLVDYWSGRGPTADGRTKPDICAPGEDIPVAKASDNNGYASMSGTSVAAPFVAGTAALILDANPSLTPLGVWQKLNETAMDWRTSGLDSDTGRGRIQAYDAVKSAGGWTGTGPSVPNHYMRTEDIWWSPTGYDGWEFTTNTLSQIAFSLITADNQCLNLELYFRTGGNLFLKDSDVPNPPGYCSHQRQLNVTFNPASSGTWELWVKGYGGHLGTYYLDFSYYGGTPILIHDE